MIVSRIYSESSQLRIFTWWDLKIDQKCTYEHIQDFKICSDKNSSGKHYLSTSDCIDLPDTLSPYVPILHRSWQVLLTAFIFRIQLM